MSTALLAVIALFLIFLIKVLNINSSAQKPVLYCKDGEFMNIISKLAPVLDEPYFPTRVWGFSGHVQTILHSVVGRVRCPWPIGERIELKLKDGATLTYDTYHSLNRAQDDVTLLLVPGICNSSESVYIRTFVHYAQCHGYRCAVLNHVGALSTTPLTSPRVFTYGYTGDLEEMVHHVSERFKLSRIILVGYSMGGNIVTKYMGLPCKKPANIIGAISICQGYDALEGQKFLLQWENLRRLYLYVMTEAMKNIVLRHKSVLLADHIKQELGLIEKDIVSAATLPEFDDAYTRKVYKFPSVEELYKWCSSSNYLDGIKGPMIFINSADDPLIPKELVQTVKNLAENRDGIVYMEVANGGHLGFYEGGYIYPNPIAWLDRAIISLVGSLLAYNHMKIT